MSVDLYAVFGNPVAHSCSPVIHGWFAQQTGQAMTYEKRLAPLNGFNAAVQAFIADGGRGANVTIPFKRDACAVATDLTPRAAAAGAVNTLCFGNGVILGDNTDGVGLVTDLVVNARTVLRGKRVLLLGAGGAAQGVVLPLLEQQPAALCVANRTASKARTLAAHFNDALLHPSRHEALRPAVSPEDETIAGTEGGRDRMAGIQSRGAEPGRYAEPNSARCLVSACLLSELDAPFDLIINATAASLADAVPLVSPCIFAPGALAYDMVYSAQPTAFMRMAASHGAAVRDGLGMLVEQAAEAFTLWRGVRPGTAAVLAALRATL